MTSTMVFPDVIGDFCRPNRCLSSQATISLRRLRYGCWKMECQRRNSSTAQRRHRSKLVLPRHRRGASVVYNPKAIEPKWQTYWEENAVFRVAVDLNKPKFYALDMFPYPSGAGLHVGHPEGYTATDILSRYKRMRGFNVLHPMGWDSYGLPAERYAMRTGIHPAVIAAENIDTFRGRCGGLAFRMTGSASWRRRILISSAGRSGSSSSASCVPKSGSRPGGIGHFVASHGSCDGTLLGSVQFPRCMGRNLPALPFAVSLDPLLADLCRLLWRQPGPFRTACTDRHPDRLACNDPLLDGVTADCIEHLCHRISN
jgi:hypothetical protein